MINFHLFLRAVILYLILSLTAYGQSQKPWIDIIMIDTGTYAFSTDHIPLTNYPPSQLFDLKMNTCWVSQLNSEEQGSEIFVALPKNISKDNPQLKVFGGYAKSKSLYQKNARVAKIKLGYYYGYIPDGAVSEFGYLGKIKKLAYDTLVNLSDSFSIQTIDLNYDVDIDEISNDFRSKYTIPVMDTIVLVSIQIIETYPGSLYQDICISELYFNEAYTSSSHEEVQNEIDSVYLSENENTLLVNKGSKAYEGKNSVLQIIETSKDMSWAIVISMPDELDGRVETTYELIDLIGRKAITEKLQEINASFQKGAPIWFIENNKGTFLVSKVHDIEIIIKLKRLIW